MIFIRICNYNISIVHIYKQVIQVITYARKQNLKALLYKSLKPWLQLHFQNIITYNPLKQIAYGIEKFITAKQKWPDGQNELKLKINNLKIIKL